MVVYILPDSLYTSDTVLSDTCKLSGQNIWVLILAIPFIVTHGDFFNGWDENNDDIHLLGCFRVK